MEIKQTLKLVLLGPCDCGKSSLILRFMDNQFYPRYSPSIGADLYTKVIPKRSGAVQLRIWDLAGHSQPPELMRGVCVDSDCCVLVYSITSLDSFRTIEDFRENYVHMAENDDLGRVPLILVGNKTDRESDGQVPWSQAQTWARQQGAVPLFQTSAKNDSAVAVMFQEATRLARAYSSNKHACERIGAI